MSASVGCCQTSAICMQYPPRPFRFTSRLWSNLVRTGPTFWGLGAPEGRQNAPGGGGDAKHCQYPPPPGRRVRSSPDFCRLLLCNTRPACTALPADSGQLWSMVVRLFDMYPPRMPPRSSPTPPRRSRDALRSLWRSSDVVFMPSGTIFERKRCQNRLQTELPSIDDWRQFADRLLTLNSHVFRRFRFAVTSFRKYGKVANPS